MKDGGACYNNRETKYYSNIHIQSFLLAVYY